MPYITAFDPGVETGIVTGYFDDSTPYEPYEIIQFGGGVDELCWWLNGNAGRLKANRRMHGDIIVSEKFIPRPIEGGSHTLESTLPLVQEGLLIGFSVMPVYPEGNWQPAAAQLLSGGSTPEERKKKSDDLLKRAGLWLTGEDVGRPNADDAISATKHALHYLCRTLRHGPTIETIYGGSSK